MSIKLVFAYKLNSYRLVQEILKSKISYELWSQIKKIKISSNIEIS